MIVDVHDLVRRPFVLYGHLRTAVLFSFFFIDGGDLKAEVRGRFFFGADAVRAAHEEAIRNAAVAAAELSNEHVVLLGGVVRVIALVYLSLDRKGAVVARRKH